VIAYGPAVRGAFVWDDDEWVAENPLLSAEDGLWRIWFSDDQPSQYFPLVYTTFRIEYSLWGLDPTGYHWTNILLHAVNALLVWWLVRRLGIPGAWLAAALFALHPVQVESVAWITERKNVLMLLFLAPVTHAWLSFVRCEDRKKRWRYYGLSLALYLLALLSKTTACTLPAALVLILWLEEKPIDRRRWAQIAPYVVLGLAMGLLTVWWERVHQGTDPTLLPLGPLERLLIAGRAIWFYLGKLFWPTDLAFSYRQWPIDAGNPGAYLWPALVVVAAWALWRWRRLIGRPPIAAMVFFVATLSPMLGLILLATFAYTYVADHYQYVASIGPLSLVAAGVVLAGRRWRPGGRAGGALVVALVLAFLGALTWRQCRAYESRETLWRDTLRKNPGSWLAHNNLGTALREAGRLDEAIEHYRRALEIERLLPDSGARIHYNLANALGSRGDLEDAANEYRRALEIQPDHLLARNNLGNVLLLLGRTNDAVEQYGLALALQPGFADGHYNLANALRAQGRAEEAVREYEAALGLDPGLAAAHFELARLLRTRDGERARRHLESALRVAPDHVEARKELATLLADHGRPTQALQQFALVLESRPDDTDALTGMAWMLATQRDPALRDAERAVEMATRAAELTERGSPTALYTLAEALGAAGRHDEAVATSEAALELASRVGASALAEQIARQRERLRLRQGP
jgi:tetratricopeptide (TPR) repeat protein